MLKLDEKKIRKGKPIGLPYQGSKKKISKKIIEIIKTSAQTSRYTTSSEVAEQLQPNVF